MLYPSYVMFVSPQSRGGSCNALSISSTTYVPGSSPTNSFVLDNVASASSSKENDSVTPLVNENRKSCALSGTASFTTIIFAYWIISPILLKGTVWAPLPGIALSRSYSTPLKSMPQITWAASSVACRLPVGSLPGTHSITTSIRRTTSSPGLRLSI